MIKTDKYNKTMKAFNEKIEQKQAELNALKEKRNNKRKRNGERFGKSNFHVSIPLLQK